VAADVIKQYAELLRSYDVHEIVSDNYAAGFSSDEWNRNGIGFRACDNDTAENFLRLLPLLTSNRARVADNATLRTQLSQLERRVVSGHEVVGHAQRARAHDDVAAACAGCLVEAAGHVSRLRAVHAGDGGADPEFPSTRDDGRPLVAVCVSTRREGPGPTKARDSITRVKLKTETGKGERYDVKTHRGFKGQVFARPADVLRALGLDKDLLGKPAAPGGSNEALKALRVDLERLISEAFAGERDGQNSGASRQACAARRASRRSPST